MTEIVVNISEAEKEKALNEIIKAQYDLIKVQQEALEKFEGMSQVRYEIGKENKEQVRAEDI